MLVFYPLLFLIEILSPYYTILLFDYKFWSLYEFVPPNPQLILGRPTLAKMYRAFLSECVAIMNSWNMCKEININGDCVWGVFETPRKTDIDNVCLVAAQLNSMGKILK